MGVLFEERGNLASQAGESPRAGLIPHAAGGFLLHFGHAHGLLGQVVREWHLRVMEESCPRDW
jgi:hypothetical protein